MQIGVCMEKTPHKKASVEKPPQEKNPQMSPVEKTPHPFWGPVEKTPQFPEKASTDFFLFFIYTFFPFKFILYTSLISRSF